MIGNLFVVEQPYDRCLRPSSDNILPKNLGDDLLLVQRSRLDEDPVGLQMFALSGAQNDASSAAVFIDQFALEPVTDGAALLGAKARHAAGAGVNLHRKFS